MVNDVKRDVAVHKELLRDSEGRRHELQVHITQTSVTLHQDTDEHRHYQEQLIAEGDQLRDQIQQLKQLQAKRDQEHQHTVEFLNQQNKRTIDILTKDHFDKITALDNESKAKIDRLQKDNHDKLTQVTNSCDLKLAQVTSSCDTKLAQVTQQCDSKLSQATRDFEQKLSAATADYNQKLSQVSTEHSAKLSQVTSELNAKISQMSADHHSHLAEAEKTAFDKVEAMRRECKQKEDRWAADIEALRQDKDLRIRLLDREREDQRSQYELKINDLESKLRSKISL